MNPSSTSTIIQFSQTKGIHFHFLHNMAVFLLGKFLLKKYSQLKSFILFFRDAVAEDPEKQAYSLEIYFKPYYRFGPYLVGIACADIYMSTKDKVRNMKDTWWKVSTSLLRNDRRKSKLRPPPWYSTTFWIVHEYAWTVKYTAVTDPRFPIWGDANTSGVVGVSTYWMERNWTNWTKWGGGTSTRLCYPPWVRSIFSIFTHWWQINIPPDCGVKFEY